MRTIVVRGSAAIYGAEPNAPSFFTEDMARRFPLRTRFQRDVGELENYFETFSRRYPEMTVTMLRYQPSLGAAIDSPLTRYLRAPVVPTQLGFDPLLQFVHADDAVAALEAAVRRPVPGPVNVAGEGSISLSAPAADGGQASAAGAAAAVRRRAAGRRAARPRAAAAGGGALASPRADGRLHAPDRGGRATARARPSTRSTTSSRRCAATGCCRGCATASA